MTMPREDTKRLRLGATLAAASAFVLAAIIDPHLASAAAREPRILLRLGIFVSRFGLSGYMLVVSTVLVAGSVLALRASDRADVADRARRLAERAAFFFAAIAASGFVCQAFKHLIGRARPRFIETLGPYHFAGPSLHSGFEGFPSGHSTTAFAAALALTLLRPRLGIIVFPAAVLICASRVLAEVHYLSDTLAGAALGTLVTLWVARTFASRDVAFTVSDPLPRLAQRRAIAAAKDRDARAL